MQATGTHRSTQASSALFVYSNDGADTRELAFKGSTASNFAVTTTVKTSYRCLFARGRLPADDKMAAKRYRSSILPSNQDDLKEKNYVLGIPLHSLSSPVQLCVCICGVMFFYLLYGYIQVRPSIHATALLCFGSDPERKTDSVETHIGVMDYGSSHQFIHSGVH